MSTEAEFESTWGLTPSDQSELWRQLRPRTAVVELVFHAGDSGHPLAESLAWLHPSRTVGAGMRVGYSRPQHAAVLHRYAYDRAIFTALDDLGGLFTCSASPAGDRVDFTHIGDVDLTLLDGRGQVLAATVTHEGLIFTPKRER